MTVGFSENLIMQVTGPANGYHVDGVFYCAEGSMPTPEGIAFIGDPGTGNWVCATFGLAQLDPVEWWWSLELVTDGYITWCRGLHVGVDLTTRGAAPSP